MFRKVCLISLAAAALCFGRAARANSTGAGSGQGSAQPPEQWLPGDVDGDGVVGVGDYLGLKLAFSDWADPPGKADLDGDGLVGPQDFKVLQTHFNDEPAVQPAGGNDPPAPHAPEPLTVLAMLAAGGVLAVYLRRRLAPAGA